MDVQFGRTRSDTRRRIAGHCFGRQRKFRMEVAAARAVETGLDDHAGSMSNSSFPVSRVGHQLAGA
jgi:hypothetical protein